jgi:type I restriction enzyme S subunit
MRAALKPYPEYRDSGVDWLGKVPTHWIVGRAKAQFCEVDERSANGDEELLSVSHKTGVTPRRLKNITMFQAESYAGYKLARPGDLVVNTMWAWMAALGVSQHHGIVSNAYGVYRPGEGAEIDGRYYDRLLRTETYRAEYIRRSTGITMSRLRLYPPKLLAMPLIQPPPEEQRRIADFLDAYAAQVHRLIAGKRRIRNLLIERRQAITRELVFGGIEQSALTESSIDWVGRVPETWRKIHLGSAADIMPGYPFDARLFSSDDGVPLIRIRDLLRGHTFLKVSGSIPDPAWVHNGDLLVGMDGDFNSVIWNGGDAALNQRLCCLRPSPRITTSYLALLLPFALKYINDLTFSTTVKHLSTFDLRRLRFPAPEVSEQNAIVAEVEERTKDLNVALSRVETEIDLILEYRDSLIAAVVTGQLDVRDAAVSTVEADDLAEDAAINAEDMENALDAVD